MGNEKYKLNKKYSLSGSYNGEIIKFFTNGTKITKEKEGSITLPRSDTITVLGGNPYGETIPKGMFKGKIYSVRIYDRQLTDEEVMKNYLIDQKRFF